ncbi:MAG: hypothetical protein WCW02_04595 [Candidatus Buchananbacteria bacterium]
MDKKILAFVVDNNPADVLILKHYARQLQLEFVDSAKTAEEAFAKIPKLSKQGVQIVFIEGNGDEQEGGMIAEAIRKECPQVKIVGYSGFPSYDWSDANLPKASISVESLLDVLKSLKLF